MEIWNERKKFTSIWSEILCRFLQGTSYSPVGFYIYDIPVCKLLQQIESYRMGEPGHKNVSMTHRFFVDDLKQYQGIYEVLKEVNKMHSDENGIYQFFVVEQADGIKTKRVKRGVEKRVNMHMNTERNDTHLISAINVKVILDAA